ncbi:MAG: hypothetical protein M3134_02545 [Actinomycetota bacterium]|nr:hypothetical protein [Actinomycetota bacterium]
MRAADVGRLRMHNSGLTGRHLTRKELGVVFDDDGIDRSGQRFPRILMHLELDAAVCSGASRGNEHTYALLDERVPAAAPLDRDEAWRR